MHVLREAGQVHCLRTALVLRSPGGERDRAGGERHPLRSGDPPHAKVEVAIADPRFGSTSFHVAALYVTLGDEKADDFFRRLKANGVKIVSGNSVVRDMVVKGEVKVGLTDTDDVNVAVQQGAPIAMVMPDKDGMGVPMMPNLVSMIARSP